MRLSCSIYPLILLGAVLGSGTDALAQGCDPAWDSLAGFAEPVWTTVVFDDGSGPALYAAGDFPSPTSTQVVRWDGASWIPVGAPLGARIHVLEVLDRGAGPELFVGGAFSGHVTVWDGASWSPLSDPGGAVRDLIVYQGELVAAGAFSRRVRRLDTSTQTWEAIGNGVNALAQSLAVHDDGSGEALYVGGSFDCAGTIGDCSQGIAGTVAIARWNGLVWTSVGGGAIFDPVVDSRILTLHVLDLGAGPQLVAGGRFDEIGGLPSANIAVWDGASWSPLGVGVTSTVHDLALFHDRTSPGLRLYACGWLSNRARKWDGVQWTSLDQGTNVVGRTMTVFDDGSGEALFVGGDFTIAGLLPVDRIARWRAAAGPDIDGNGFPDPCESGLFLRGDGNTDGLFDLADAIFSLNFLFPIGNPPSSPLCGDAMDANDDGFVTIADPITQLTALFSGPAPLPAPFPICGLDSTTDLLGCTGPVPRCP